MHSTWVSKFGQSIAAQEQARAISASTDSSDILQDLRTLTTCLNQNNDSSITNLQRPSRLTLLWPKLVLVPPIALYAISRAYASRADLVELAKDARETVRGFIVSWVMEPLKGIVNTVRANPDEGVIISKEGVVADIQVTFITL